MIAKGDEHDPKGLIFEAYRIDGINKSECRTIFLDWALSLPDAIRPVPAIDVLLDRYGAGHADHPMTEVLTEGRAQVASPKRRGGWRSRSRPQ
ncbi:MAG: hypothetical protein ABJX32_05545 [Tateyamaria sp.]|uniref:hypothetical protein n=1 Tax=unclassified Tateyamaria TaxID=2645127 RepID=UPI000D553C5B|nr:hypothetical protein [Tateyamaria sp. Alg231-49]